MKRIVALLFTAFFTLSACGTLTNDGGLLLRTADPRVNIGFRLLQPSLLPTVTPTPVTPAPPVEPQVAPPCDAVAGNINSQGKKLYHTPDSPQFNQVKIDEAKGERWFCDTVSAEAAGWTRAGDN